MSQFLPAPIEQPKQQAVVPAKGPEDFLSLDERQFLQRILNYPEDLPSKFRSWLVDFIAVNIPMIPISQIVGFTQFQARSETVTGSQSCTNTNYGNLATPGPTLTGISDGAYLIWFGFKTDQDADCQAFMSLSINGSAASDTDACQTGVDGLAGDQVRASISRAVSKSLKNSNNNTIQAKYKAVQGNGSWPSIANRWIIALRIGA